MNTTEIALVGYVTWSLVLAFAVVTTRVHAQIVHGRAANSFTHDGSDLGEWGHRITRAHANSMEWIGLPAALLLLAIATQQTEITQSLALYALAARVLQSSTHLIATNPLAVSIRGTFLGLQTIFWLIWSIQFLRVYL